MAVLTLVLELPPAAARAAGGPRVFPQNAPCCIWQMRANVWGRVPSTARTTGPAAARMHGDSRHT